MACFVASTSGMTAESECIRPPRSKFFQSLLSNHDYELLATGDLPGKNTSLHVNRSNEQTFCSAILEVELDQHKNMIADTVRRVCERDCVIRAQGHHIRSLCQRIHELELENLALEDSVAHLRTLTESLQTSEDYGGIGQKRKACS